VGALVGAVHQRFVGPLEIEGVNQRFPQLRLSKLLAPGIDEPTLSAGGSLVANDLAFDPPVAHRWKIVPRCPDA
jgi:hypothetical protein